MVNNDNFLLKEIPKFHPLIQRWERIGFWRDVKKRIFEGLWVGGRWCPPELYFHVNLSTIQFLGGGRNVQGIGQPWFRDIEWEKAFIYSEACGFSGFIDDPVYTCLMNVLTETKDDVYRDFCTDKSGNRIDRNYYSIFTKDGEFKKYWDARTYFWRTDMSSSFGNAIYLNTAKNVIDMESRACSAKGTKILMYDGTIKNIEDVVVGDKLMGKDSTCRNVLHTHNGIDNLSRIKHSQMNFDDVIVTNNHNLSVINRIHINGKYENRKRLKGTYKTEETSFKVSYLKERQHMPYFSNAFYRYKKDIVYNFEKETTPAIDPYYFGLWLADGRSNCTSIKITDEVLWDYLEKFALDNNIKCKLSITKAHDNSKEAREFYYSDDNFRELFKLYDLVYKTTHTPLKYVPNDFLFSSEKNRLDLLAGIIDGDGSYDVARKHIVITTGIHESLARGYLFLCRSLGLRASMTIRKRDGNKDMYIVRINGDLSRIPTKLHRKQVEKVDHRVSMHTSSFKIEDYGVGEFYGIEVDVDNEFLLEDFSVEHNTGKSYWASSCIQHSILTDGARFYDEYVKGRSDNKPISVSQTLVAAIESKYSNDLISKVKFSLEHLPGEINIRLNGEDKHFPSPLLPEFAGSWEAGAKSPIHDTLSGSSIIHRTFMDNPLAANGTRPTRAFLEEVGFLSTIQEVLGAVEATQGNVQTNKYLPIYMLGTGGYTTTGTALWLKQIFYDPENYNCLSFDDVWENKGKIGYFVPASRGQNDFKEGPNLISNEARAIKSIEAARESARKSNNKVKILTTIINQPLTPSEVFMTIDGNFFPVEDLRECLYKLESNPTIFNKSYKYEMIMVDGKVFPKLSDKQVIREFPIKKGINMDAPIEVYELPKKNGNGDIPYGRYLASWDPIDVDGNEDTSQSLQSIFIMDSWTDRLVAEYTARTYLASEYYEQARRLFIYYNALCNYESNLKGPYAHFLNKNSLHLFCDTPEILSDKSIGGKGGIGNKSKGTRVGGNASGSPIINYGVNEILSWIESPAYDKPEGTRVMDTLQGPQLLRELISYSPQLNCDRISSLVLLMIIRADRKRITDVSKTQSIKTKASDPLWSRPFGGNKYNLYGGYAQKDLNRLR